MGIVRQYRNNVSMKGPPIVLYLTTICSGCHTTVLRLNIGSNQTEQKNNNVQSSIMSDAVWGDAAAPDLGQAPQTAFKGFARNPFRGEGCCSGVWDGSVRSFDDTRCLPRGQAQPFEATPTPSCSSKLRVTECSSVDFFPTWPRL